MGARFWRLQPEKKVTVVCLMGCAVVSVFGSGDYDQKNKVTVVCLASCAVVSVFGSGDYNRKKKLQSSVWRVVLLCQFLVLAITTGKNKSYSRHSIFISST